MVSLTSEHDWQTITIKTHAPRKRAAITMTGIFGDIPERPALFSLVSDGHPFLFVRSEWDVVSRTPRGWDSI